MYYLLLTAGTFFADTVIKKYIDRTFTRRVTHPRAGGRIILEKYYNRGAALNLLEKRPKLLCLIHTAILGVTGAAFWLLLKEPGRPLTKTGMALLTGGGFSNLLDRYTKGHVVDYFHINIGPAHFRRIVFNLSDLCIFAGALLAVIGDYPHLSKKERSVP